MKFDIGIVLSISHDHLLCDIGKVYENLNFMLDENLYTHQLPRAGKFCRPFVLQQHPQLTDWDILDVQVTTANWKDMVGKATAMFGESLEIEKLPGGVWTEKDPIEEAKEIMGNDGVIVLNI